jgi:hypothetical protein
MIAVMRDHSRIDGGHPKNCDRAAPGGILFRGWGRFAGMIQHHKPLKNSSTQISSAFLANDTQIPVIQSRYGSTL